MKTFPGIPPENPGAALERTLSELETFFHVHITVHDSQANFVDENGLSFFEKRYFHQAPYCLDGRYDIPDWNDRCKLDCAFMAEAIAHQEHKSFLHPCWKGVCELIVPVEENNTTILLFYAGPFRTEHIPEPEKLPPDWIERWKKLPLPAPSDLETLTRLLLLAGHGMLHYARGARRKNLPVTRRGLIRKFLDEHSHENISFSDLCRELALSPSRTRVMVNHHFGVSFRKLLETERMLRAGQMLLTSDLPLKQIAEAVGYRNEFHFNRAFRRHFGVPPGHYRDSAGTSASH